MKKVIIKAGTNKPKGFHNWPHLFKSHIGYTVIFTGSCRYAIPGPDAKDLNKLPGLSQGYHHWNSARSAWRWNPNLDVIELFSYCYVRKENLYVRSLIEDHEDRHRLGYFSLNSPIDIDIYIDADAYFIQVCNDGHIADERIERGSFPNIGYRLGNYFGGKRHDGKRNTVAPHDVQLIFT